MNQGHCHPRILRHAQEQADARDAHVARLPQRSAAAVLRGAGELCGMEMVLPMNTGAEAVETAIKAARRWGYMRQGHSRRTRPRSSSATAIFTAARRRSSASRLKPAYREGFGPFTPGFARVPFGDIEAARSGDQRAHVRRSCSSRFSARPASSFRPTDYLSGLRRAVPRAERAVDRRRDPDRARPHRPTGSPATTRASSPTCTCSARRCRAASIPVSAVVSTRATCWACSGPAATAAPSAAIRSAAPSRALRSP